MVIKNLNPDSAICVKKEDIVVGILIFKERMLTMKCTVKLIWDSETNRWYTGTDEVPGLVLESSSFDTLIDKVRLAAPEMLELNCDYTEPVYMSFEAERIEKVS